MNVITRCITDLRSCRNAIKIMLDNGMPMDTVIDLPKDIHSKIYKELYGYVSNDMPSYYCVVIEGIHIHIEN